MEAVFERAAGLLNRDLTNGQAAMLEQFCSGAWSVCVSRLRSDVEPEQAESALLQAAALLAAGMFLDTESTGEVTSFTAGKLSVTTGADGRAARFRACARELLGPWCDGGFAFLGVRG